MRITWFGQSAFRLEGDEATVVIDPHGDVDNMRRRGMRFDYPPMDGLEADVLLVTHEHVDHNGVERIDGSPETFRSRAGTFDSRIGQIVGIASEHDDRAGTLRGDNTMFRFEYGGLGICHMGDFGQASLRDEQRLAVGSPELIFMPVGDGPTMGPRGACELIETIGPRFVIPMHYRTEAMDFLEPVDPFLEMTDAEVLRLDSEVWEFDPSEAPKAPVVVVPAPPA